MTTKKRKTTKKKVRIPPAPRTNAKTADEALAWVERVIADEPRRYDQHITVAGPSDLTDMGIAGRHRPACNSVACVGGWLAIGLRPKGVTVDQVSMSDALTIAGQALGLSYEMRAELFSGIAVGGQSMSRTHANYGVSHIQRFRARYATYLKKMRVRRPKMTKRGLVAAPFKKFETPPADVE